MHSKLLLLLLGLFTTLSLSTTTLNINGTAILPSPTTSTLTSTPIHRGGGAPAIELPGDRARGFDGDQSAKAALNPPEEPPLTSNDQSSGSSNSIPDDDDDYHHHHHIIPTPSHDKIANRNPSPTSHNVVLPRPVDISIPDSEECRKKPPKNKNNCGNQDDGRARPAEDGESPPPFHRHHGSGNKSQRPRLWWENEGWRRGFR